MKKYGKVIIWCILTISVIVFDMFVLPNVGENKTKVEYSEFINSLDNKVITEVQIHDDKLIYYTNSKENNAFEVAKLETDERLISRLEETENVVYDKTEESKTTKSRNFFLQWILPWFVVLSLFKGISKITKQDGTKNFWESTKLRFDDKNFDVIENCETTFADVAGQDEAKETLLEIVDYLHDSDKYNSIGAKIPKGVLLVGPPGTGKTLMAKAVAGEANVPFFSISGSAFVEMYVGMGAAKVRKLFQQAREKAPCIIFIDEIDTIGKKRDGSGANNTGNDEREQTLNQLLIEMDGFNDKSNIVILAATNRPESLDKALLRPGRFDRRVPLELPDYNGRLDILTVHTKNVKIHSEVDFNLIAKTTSGVSGAEIANIVNEAALRAVKMKRDYVIQEDFDEAIDVVAVGYQRKNALVSDKDKLIVAYHEIGHALAIALLTKSTPVHKITIVPRTSGALGYTMQIDDADKVLYSREDLYNRIVALTAGRAAEEVIYGYYTTGAANDMEKATQIARGMVTRFGMSDEFDMMALSTESSQYLQTEYGLNCSLETATKIDKEVLSIIKSAHNDAIKLLEANKEKLTELSLHLYEKETITGEEFMDYLDK